MTERVVKTLYLVRHGQTIGNTDKVLYTPEEDLLNDNGKLEASLLGKRLKDVRFDKQYISNHPRTKQTADLILLENEKNKSPLVVIDERIREIDYTQSYGGPYGDVFKALIKFIQTDQPIQNYKVDESENGLQLGERTKSFVADFVEGIFGKRENETILMVSHGLCIASLMDAFSDEEKFELVGWDEETGPKIMRNTSSHKMKIMEREVKEGDGRKFVIEFEELHNMSHIPKSTYENDSLTRLVKSEQGKCLSGCFQV